MSTFWRRCAVVAALLLLGACASLVGPVEEPRVSLTSLRMLPASGGQQRIEVGLRVMNPNGFDLQAAGIVVDAGFNDIPVVSGAVAAPPVVPAYGEAQITVPLSASLLNGIRLLRSIAENPDDPVSYRLQLRMDLKLPMSRSITILEQGQISPRPPAPPQTTPPRGDTPS